MDLYLIRHAWAGDGGDSRWPNDDLRPLTELGRKRFAKMASKLADRGMSPEVIASSPLTRCLETAEIVAGSSSNRPKIVELPALRPGSNLETLMAWTVQQAEHCTQIAWVGHSPDMDRIACQLIGADNGLIRFAKGSVAALRFDGPLEIGAGELRWLATAKLLGC
jgi:phosphohistidine phosphatase